MTIANGINGVMCTEPSLHVVLVPLMAQGHTIPMLDLARLLAHRGVLATVVTTPSNAARIKSTIDAADNLPLRFAVLPFPSAEVGLPEGSENMDAVSQTLDVALKFFKATTLLRRPLESYLRSHHPPPTCIISDSCHPWTLDVARALNIPRFSFFGIACFTLLCDHNISYDGITDVQNEPFVIPGLNHRIEVTAAQAPGFFAGDDWTELREGIKAADEASDGVVVNSFEELEPWYVENYEKAMGKKVWVLGPFSLCERGDADVAARGNDAAVAVKGKCAKWLDAMQPKSVVYVSFGSLAIMPFAQLVELGLGLEASGVPFIWVVKAVELQTPEAAIWLDGFEERNGTRGIVVRGWAPQMVILSDPAVGGFMTHCGWNSSLESIAAGVPMMTWPFFADQFLNERMLVDVLGVAVGVGVKGPRYDGVDDEVLSAGRDEVELVVRGLMGSGGNGARESVRELAVKAKKAMEEGGSSHANMTRFIRHISLEASSSHVEGKMEP